MCDIPTTIGVGVARVLLRTLGTAATAAVKNYVLRPIERIDARRQAQSDLQLRVIKALGDKEVDAVKNLDPKEYADILEESTSHRSRWKQRNLNDTVVRALGKLSKDTIENQTASPSDEFMDSYIPKAENQSTEHMQELFARILAGEIEKPGSFSKKALQVAEGLDQPTAKLFRRLCSMALVRDRLIFNVNGKFYYRVSKFTEDMVVCSLKGNAGENSLEKFGLRFSSLNRLAEHGLVVPGISVALLYHASVQGELSPVIVSPFRFQDKLWILRKVVEKSFAEYRVTGVSFSAIGQELFKIVEKKSMRAYQSELNGYFFSEGLQMVEVEAFPVPQ